VVTATGTDVSVRQAEFLIPVAGVVAIFAVRFAPAPASGEGPARSQGTTGWVPRSCRGEEATIFGFYWTNMTKQVLLVHDRGIEVSRSSLLVRQTQAAECFFRGDEAVIELIEARN
jgi:hypothetical protein